jgi:epoxyqueuosine reductase
MSQTLMPNALSTEDLLNSIRNKAKELGFQQLGVSTTDLEEHVEHYQNWIKEGLNADLEYMKSHGSKRWKPQELVDGTLRVISLRMDYLPEEQASASEQLNRSDKAYISRYTLGRDYHKLVRSRLKHLIKFIEELCSQSFEYRAFVDSAPVLERAIAQKAGLGWFGKNTMIINREAGSWFFLGEIYTNLALPVSESYEDEHCGRCTACLDICPTNAFVGPYKLDAAKCISYLTIENKSEIPEQYRKAMGNRIFGCDDCQLVCPWNRFASLSVETDFTPRNKLDDASLVELFLWTEEEFLSKTEGSAIRRAGYLGWLRNIAVALGNAPSSKTVIDALQKRSKHESSMVREHVTWALNQHTQTLKIELPSL